MPLKLEDIDSSIRTQHKSLRIRRCHCTYAAALMLMNWCYWIVRLYLFLNERQS